MSPVLSRSRPPTLGAPRRRAAGVAAVAVAVVALAASVRFLPQPVATHDLTVVNPHPWAAVIEVGATGGDDRVVVGTVGREHTRTFTEVPLRGTVVTLRFTYHGLTVEQQLQREELAAAEYGVEVPAQFGAELTAAGVSPTVTIP